MGILRFYAEALACQKYRSPICSQLTVLTQASKMLSTTSSQLILGWMLPHARENVRFLDASSESMSIDFRHNQHLALINASMTSESAVAELILLALDAAIPEQLSFIL